jgi:hypothetical protein
MNRTRRVKVEDGFVIIPMPSGSTYDIPLSRMKTPAAVLDWIHQVCVAKTWGKDMTAEILEAIFYDAIPSKMWSGKG